MAVRYAIGPAIGVARLGNSPDDFYLAPEAIGGLPIEYDPEGKALNDGGRPECVTRFKDSQGRVRRQGALFRIFRIDDDNPGGIEVTLDRGDVAAIEWTVHLANKKAAWYQFAELEGNLLYGESNSYDNVDPPVPLRNAGTTGDSNRRKLIIDPGPRTLGEPNQRAVFDHASVPAGYKFASFPSKPNFGEQITSLGEVRTDAAGRLVVLGGAGDSGGDTVISSFGGADTWHDDISDGPVNCRLTLKDGSSHDLNAWCIVGSPKFAPEVVNIVTLADTAWDTAVRNFGAVPDLLSGGKFNEDYVANFDRDIAPILNRPGGYRWVANTPSMSSLSPAPFDARDKSDATAPLRRAYLALFRQPNPQDAVGDDAGTLFGDDGFPLMPLNSGSNSVSNQVIDKFLALTQTQYFLLGQWAAGKFSTDPAPAQDRVDELTRASIGNCVGGPFCPGIEVTWTTRNPTIYDGPMAILQRHPSSWYFENGLSPSYDETYAPIGCEPGDLTKRMAIPWQADFFQCSIQYVNFTDPKVNKANGIPQPPTYYAYWWPPQSPWLVMTGDLTADAQNAAGTPAGQQVLYTRGINTFAQMITAWSYMGFIVNQARGPYGSLFPNLVEQERNHDMFIAAAVAIGESVNVVSGADSNFSNAWFMPQPAPQRAPVTFATSRRQGRVSLRD